MAETLALLPTDRCDRCGARAHLRAWLAGSELLFCAHHAKANHAALVEQGARIEVE